MCPVGCRISVTIRDGTPESTMGYGCQRGEDYVRQEVQQPRRVVISVVRCYNGDIPTVSVKTSSPVPKDTIRDVMATMCTVQVTAPIEVGDILVSNICNLGVNVVATRGVARC